MMFKLDPETEKITDHVFVDLQITRLASPNVDLGYFLYTSVKNAVRRQNLTELLQHYFTNFVKTLTMFDENCPISFEDFVKDYSEKSQFGFFFNLNILTALEVMKDINFDNMSDDPKTYMDEFTALINDWIVKHPEKSSEISVEIVAVINENEKILDDARSS
ncbi:uncharacterized protein LOC110843241 [Folsomia candida]|nr:uncharacterized protein LOC110843241 [Folsomia candida]